MGARKKYFDEDVPDDVQAVVGVSALLGVSEFRLFEIAYRFWYGRAADERTIERHFAPYMFGDVVPPWVRHFSQRVLAHERDGTLEPEAFGVRPRHASAADIHRGRMFAVCLITAMVALVLLAELAVDKVCMFPPCY